MPNAIAFSTHDAAKRMIDEWTARYLGSAGGPRERSERLDAIATMVGRAIGQELAFLDATGHEPADPFQWPAIAGKPTAPAAQAQKAA